MGYLGIEPQEFISSKAYSQRMTRGFPEENDLFFTTEAPLGNTCLVTSKEEKITPGQRIITLSPYYKNYALSKFMMYQIMSPSMQLYLNRNATGVTAKGIKAATLKKLSIILPPLAEQRIIVERVEKLLSHVDQFETQVTARKSNANALLQTVLRDAFEGHA